MLISSLHPSSLKSKRQLDFSQPIELALGCSFTLPKLKNKNPLDSAPLALKSERQLRFTQQIVLAPGLAEGQNLILNLFSGTKKHLQII